MGQYLLPHWYIMKSFALKRSNSGGKNEARGSPHPDMKKLFPPFRETISPPSLDFLPCPPVIFAKLFPVSNG